METIRKQALPCIPLALSRNLLLFLKETLAEPVGLPNELQDMGLVREPIQESCCHFFVPKHLIPFAKPQIRGHDDGHPFIQVGAQLKQQLRTIFPKGNKSEFVEYHEVELDELCQQFGEPQILLCREQVIHQVIRAKEPHAFPLLAGCESAILWQYVSCPRTPAIAESK